jgi:cation transport ATPase
MGAVGSDVTRDRRYRPLSNELLKLPFALRLARATLERQRPTLPCRSRSGGVLVAAVTGNAHVWMAVLAAPASVIVVANALRASLRAR